MTAADSPVEQYLDDMFDRLAGTGPAGRRMLAEAESHLFAAVEDGCARGLDSETAEREAVARFGPAAGLARQVPVGAGDTWGAVRRLLVGAWVAAGAALTWYAVSGLLTWLLNWPWTRLLIATDRFGTQPDMCAPPWLPANSDCLTQYRGYLNVVPWGGDEFPWIWAGLIGVVLLLAWVRLRHRTVPPHLLGLGLAVPFGLGAAVLLFYGVIGMSQGAQNYALSYLVAGLLAATISVLAGRRQFG